MNRCSCRTNINIRPQLLAVSAVPTFMWLFVLSQAAIAEDAPRGYLGVYAQSNSNVLQKEHGFEGITVTSVVENSPAAAAGIKAGDIILRANKTDLTDPNQLNGLVESLPVGSRLALRIERDRAILELETRTVAKIVPSGKATGEKGKSFIENRRLGFEFFTPAEATAVKLKLAPKSGIEIGRVAAKSPLAKSKLAAGSVIESVNGETIQSPEAFLQFLDSHPGLTKLKLSVVEPSGKRRTVRTALRVPPRETRNVNVFPLFKYSREPNKSLVSIPILFTKRERLAGATKYQFLWFIAFETGDSGELLEVGDE